MSAHSELSSAEAAPDGESLKATFRRLKRAQKSMRNAPAWSRWVNRPIGRALAVVAYRLGLTPNHVTSLSALFTLSALAVVMLVSPSWPVSIGVAGGLVLAHALDAADGQLARLRGGGSALGEFFDHTVDAIKCALVHVAVVVSLYRFGDLASDRWLIVPLAFSVVESVNFFGNVLKDQLRIGRLPAGQTDAYLRPDATRQPILPSLVLLPADYGVLAASFALLPATRVFLGVYTFLFVVRVMYFGLALRRWTKAVAAYS
jgi:phosphatidylglycerophosphate synthase